jgi:hypothetical protein
MPGTVRLTAAQRRQLLDLQRRALCYFLDNQLPSGLVLDRQSNRGRRRRGLCSTSATGMGLIALALACARPHRLLTTAEARTRVRRALQTARDRLPADAGALPHFVEPHRAIPWGVDAASTIDTGWLLVGGLWAAAFLGDRDLADLAEELSARVLWRSWAVDRGAGPLLRHGRARDGRLLDCTWDRLNGETVFLYVLATGAEAGRALSPACWGAFRSFPGRVAGLRFHHADLGLFVFQYGLDLLCPAHWAAHGGEDLHTQAGLAARANEAACRERAERWSTFRCFWGLSAGDGPLNRPPGFAYRAYSPAGPIDGTAHLTAALASVAHVPEAVFRNLHAAWHERRLPLLGRYGLSTVNLDRQWVGPDMVGIDAGAAVLALDNVLHDDRVRATFHSLSPVQRALSHLRPARRAA